MTLKLSFAFLVAAISALACLPKAQAKQPKDDFFVHVSNSTSHTLEICNSELTFCGRISPGKTFSDAHSSGGKGIDYFGFWLSHRLVKLCGKVVPLKKIINIPMADKGARGKVTYRLNISEESYLRECGTSPIPH